MANPGQRILFVEDVPSDAELARRVLEQGGLTFESVRVDTEDAFVAALEEFEPDLVISAYAMTGLDGMRALALSLARDATRPFIVLTAVLNDEIAAACLRAGATNFVRKDRLARLPFAVTEALEHHQARLAQEAADRAVRDAEEALRESEERYRFLLENSDDAILLTVPDGSILAANPAACRMFGCTEAEICRMGRDGVVDPIDPRLPAALEERERTGRFRGELTFLRRDGQPFTGEITTAVFRDAAGRPRTSMTIRDVTQRMRAEDALRQSEERYRNLVDRAADGIAIIQDGMVRYANPRLAEMRGDTVEAVIDTPFVDYVDPDELPTVVNRYQRRMAGEDVTPIYETVLRRKDGSKWFAELNAGAVPYQGRTADLVIVRDVTERKRAEDALRESEVQYRELADSITDVFFAMDKDLRYTYWNKASEILTGIPAQDALGKSLLEVFPDTPETSMAEKVYRDVLTAQQPQVFETGYILGGEPHSFEISAYPSQHGISVFVKDTTERKRLEEKLENERRELELISNTSPIIVFYKDKEGRFIRVNKAFAEALRMPEEDFVGKTVFDLYSPKIARGMTDDDQQVLESGCPKLNIIEQYESASGIRWVQTDKIPICDKNGIPVGQIGFAQDITERKRAEEALRESEERFRRLYEHAPLGYQSLDAEGRLVEVNQAWLDLLGCSRDQVIGRPFVDFLAPHEVDAAKQRFPHFLATGEVHVDVEMVQRAGATIVVHLDGSIGRDQHGQFQQTHCILHDVTSRKRAEEALRESEERFRLIFDNMSSGVVVYEPTEVGQDFVIKDFNRAAAGIECISREQVVGRSVLDVFPAVKEFGLFQVLQRVWETGQAEHHPISRYQDERLSGWRDNYVCKLPSGEVVAIYDDITERKRAEEALRESEERFRRLYEHAPLGYQSLDAEGRLVEVNQAWLDLLGYSRDQVIGRSFGDFLAPQEGDAFRQRFPRFKATGEVHVDLEMVPCTGGTIIVSIDGTIGHDQHGQFKQTHCILHNVTARKRAEEELRRLHEQVQRHAAELEERVKERTAELRQLVNGMAGREIRMAELKEVVKQLRAQLQQAGLEPVADDPLAAGMVGR